MDMDGGKLKPEGEAGQVESESDSHIDYQYQASYDTFILHMAFHSIN